MKRIIQVFDSTGQMWDNLTIETDYFKNTATWVSPTPGFWEYSSGKVSSRTWGIDLLADDGRENWVLMARLHNFWKVDGIWCNDDGKAEILRAYQLKNDSEGRWKFHS